MKLPEHMRIQLSAFVRSDKAGAGAEIKVGGCVDTDIFSTGNLKLDGFTKAACDSLNAALDVDDTRPMTAKETREHIDEQMEDERAAGRISEMQRLGDSDAD